MQQLRGLAGGASAHALMDLYGAAAAGIGQRRGGGHRVDRRRGLYHIGIVVTAQAQIAGCGRRVHLMRVQRQW